MDEIPPNGIMQAKPTLRNILPPMSAYGLPVKPELEPLMNDRIKCLPVDKERGYPVPYFVPWIDGKPEFRIAVQETKDKCIREKLCWVCGQKMGNYLAFVVGPMCALNRISAEPPSHLDCAEFSVKACPFLARPHAKRREDEVTEQAKTAPGFIARNPGVSLIWITKGFRIVKVPDSGYLIRMDASTAYSWWKEGRKATYTEVENAVNSGLEHLRTMSFGEDESEIQERLKEVQRMYPAELENE